MWRNLQRLMHQGTHACGCGKQMRDCCSVVGGSCLQAGATYQQKDAGYQYLQHPERSGVSSRL